MLSKIDKSMLNALPTRAQTRQRRLMAQAALPRFASGQIPSVRENDRIAVNTGMTVSPSTQSIDLRLLIAGIEELDAGFTVFDADLRSITANARFRQMLGFSVDLCQPGTPFSAFLRDNAERGEYGKGDIEDLVATRLALARQFLPHRFERVRPDGGVIDVRGRPLPGTRM
ncbi:PAS-domain containing protein [Rhodoferax sp. PAMC 29310]|uniref:PAS domain-containing protein n=1 Tax=Rhodoferax sp. PAMC 29310 TaxID=2822760 RepID=UPI001F0B591C|nr:PAS-domain containing protein [Rhodoferax sp. PAMC 29310]